MKQQKRTWRRLPTRILVILVLLTPILGVLVVNLVPSQSVRAADLPPGVTCPPPGTWDGAICQTNPSFLDECDDPYKPDINNNGGFNPSTGHTNVDRCVFTPPGVTQNNGQTPTGQTPGEVAAEAPDDAKAGQQTCDDSNPGTVFDPASTEPDNCRAPANADECKNIAAKNMNDGSTYTFQEGDGADTPAKCIKDDNDTCPIPKQGNGSTAMRWIACPVSEGLNSLLIGCPAPAPPPAQPEETQGQGGTAEGNAAAAATGKNCTGGLNGVIRAFLYTDPARIFGNSNDAGANNSSTAFHTSWGVFRTIGVGLVIIAGLIMIVSEAMGFGFVDAYTIRKLLPRLLVVAIGITLSWSVCAFLVTFFNDLGGWAQDLITFPFQGLNPREYDVGRIIAEWLSLIGLGAGALIGTVYLVTVGFAGILSLLLTLVAGLLVAVGVLIIRQMLILLCIIVSPVALACAVLPNTQRVFSLWLSTFIRTLIMYPVIIGFISLGIVFSWIASQTPSLLNGFLAIFAFILPYFMLPYAFKLSGGAMATVANLAQDRLKPFQEKQKERRGEIYQKRKEKANAGLLYTGKNKFTAPFAKRANKVLAGIGTGWEGKWGASGVRPWKSRDKWNRNKFHAAQAENYQHYREGLEKSAWWKKNGGADDVVRAMRDYDTMSEAAEGMKAHYLSGIENPNEAQVADAEHRAHAVAELAASSGGFGGANRIAGAVGFAATGTAYTSGDAGKQDLISGVGAAAGGNQYLMDQTAAEIAGATAQNGRHEMNWGFGMTKAAIDHSYANKGKLSDEFIKGAPTYADGRGSSHKAPATAQDDGRALSMDENSWLRTDANTAVRDKPHAPKTWAVMHRENVQQGLAKLRRAEAGSTEHRSAQSQLESGLRGLSELSGSAAGGMGHNIAVVDRELNLAHKALSDARGEAAHGATHPLDVPISQAIANVGTQGRIFEARRSIPFKGAAGGGRDTSPASAAEVLYAAQPHEPQ